jgi:serine/threonine protein kinase
MPDFDNPETWQRLEDLFHRAVELPPGDRARFLDEACQDDPGLRTRLEAMLEAEAQPADAITQQVGRAARDFLAPPPDLTLQPGTTLGPYRIVGLLGAGGMGRVYRARDTRLDRDVAIKTLAPEAVPNPRSLEFFEQEARAASALNHPNILTIYEIGEFRGARYIVSEFVDGKTLSARIGEGRLDIAAVLDIAIQVATGLVAAHAARIVHRDIKPENLLVRADGLVKIVDFGIAKLSEGRRMIRTAAAAGSPAARTRTGTIVGTAKYMSPSRRADRASTGGATFSACRP